jgi:hypothetical protein
MRPLHMRRAGLDHVSLVCLPTAFPIMPVILVHRASSSVTDVTCLRKRAAISSVLLHREPSVLWLDRPTFCGRVSDCRSRISRPEIYWVCDRTPEDSTPSAP